MSEILTAEQLADRWQVEKGWIYAKCRTGELPKVPLPGKYVRFRLDVIEAFEQGDFENAAGRGSANVVGEAKAADRSGQTPRPA